MATITRSSGIQISLPAGYAVSAPVAPPGTRRKGIGVSGTASPESTALVNALEQSDMELLDAFELLPGPIAAIGSRRGVRAQDSGQADIVVDLSNEEHAMLLLEQDGFYMWQFPVEQGTVARGKRTIVQGDAARHQVAFRFMVSPVAPPKQRSGDRNLLGSVGDFIAGRAKAYVLKFTAALTVKTAMKFLERNVRQGLVVVRTVDPRNWNLFDDISALRLPAGRRPRVLLLVHGTFSSTIGGFGALTATDHGKDFLRAAWKSYDAVIGYDHPTLSADPAANAADLLKRLRGLGWTEPPQLDIVTHSRGALVSRLLVERLIPRARWGASVGTIVFAGGTNGGTLLAEPDNWHSLINLYTNLIVGSCRAIGLIPQAKAATAVIAEVAKGLGAFIKYSATFAVTAGGVPGLAAMEPDSKLVEELNAAFPATLQSQYYTITSDFKPRVIGGDHQPRELPLRMVQWLANGAVDGLMKEANDLVVNTRSMSAMETIRRDSFTGRLDFGKNPEVYHTNYFAMKRVVDALASWLGAGIDDAPAPPSRASRSSSTVGHKPQKVAAGGAGRGKGTRTTRVAPSSDAADTKRTGSRHTMAFRGGMVGAAHPVRTGDEIPGYHVTEGSYEIDAFQEPEWRKPVKQAMAAGRPRSAARASRNPGTGDTLSSRRGGGQTAGSLQGAARGAGKTAAGRKTAAATGAARPPAAVPPAREKADKVLCHFHAMMDDQVVLQRAVTVEVRVSREAIERAAEAASQKGSARINPKSKLVVRVIPKQNYEVLGPDQVEIDPPVPGEERDLVFNVRGTHTGDGVIWVEVRQQQAMLLMLQLNSTIRTRPGTAAEKVSAGGYAAQPSRTIKPVDMLRITEQVNGNQTVYDFDLDLLALPDVKRYRSAPIVGNRDAYITNLYEEIESRWVSSRGDGRAFVADLRAFGAQIFQQLIPVELQRILWKKRKELKKIMVISSEPFIPWELVHLRNPDMQGLPRESLFLGQMGLMRWFFNVPFRPTTLKIRKGRAHYVIPRYLNQTIRLPEAEQEETFLKKRFGAAATAAEPDRVRALISSPGNFDLLHFACHGEADGKNIANARLMLQDRQEQGTIVPTYFSATTAEQYGNIAGTGTAPMVVINACQIGRAGYALTNIGGFAHAFIQAGAGVFVGTLWSVGDSPARTFTETLYAALLDGETLGDATIRARAAARKAGDATWLAYVVYGHPQMKIAR